MFQIILFYFIKLRDIIIIYTYLIIYLLILLFN